MSAAPADLAAALAAHAAGRLGEAERLYLAMLEQGGEQFRIRLQLGVLRLQQGDVDASIEASRRAIELDAGSAEAHANLATALHVKGDEAAAIAAYETALALDPNRAESYYGLGSALMGRSPEEASGCFARAAALDADYAEAYCALGAACFALGRHLDALAPFERALAIDPDYAEAHRGRAAALQGLRRAAEAAVHYERAASLAPEHPASWLGLGAVQRALGRHEAAQRSYSQALAVAPDSIEARLGLGAVLHELGRLSEARVAYEAVLLADPRNVSAHCGLVALARVAAGDPCLLRLERLAGERLSDDDQIAVQFALGKALTESGEPERAFRHLVAGNQLRRRQLAYDEANTLSTLERVAEVFTPQLLVGKRGAGDPSTRPIFIVGMPRCGSTLIEQVLASVAGVFGAGERSDLSDAARRAGLDDPAAPFPQAVPGLCAAQIRAIAADYLGSIGASAPAAARITDKMLMNFCMLGLIHLALPGARVIHLRRDPVDTCLSCFATYFEQVPYAFDLGELGRYYRAYAQLMEHWRRVLPRGVMLDVSYEALVRNFEPEVRRVLEHCGLTWSAACLSFYKTERAVGTASKSQVRQPLYQSSVGRWRPPADMLRPLLDGLGEARVG